MLSGREEFLPMAEALEEGELLRWSPLLLSNSVSQFLLSGNVAESQCLYGKLKNLRDVSPRPLIALASITPTLE